MSDEPMKKDPIWLCADVWLNVFPWLPPRQLGLRVAMVGDRFDALVDGHFRSRKWTFGDLEIDKQMLIRKWIDWFHRKSLPIPREGIPFPDNVVGFKSIVINSIDRNVLAFLHRIRRLFDTCAINLSVGILGCRRGDRLAFAFFFANIWPLIKGNICWIAATSLQFPHFRRFSPTILADCPSLKLVSSSFEAFPEFPADDSATASMGQAVAKWLFTPRGDGIPKVFKCGLHLKGFGTGAEELKREFAKASSRVNFIISLLFQPSVSIAPFDLTNELTGERLTAKQIDMERCVLVRGPISRDEKQWAEWEEEALEWNRTKQWNRLNFAAHPDDFGDGLLDSADVESASS